MHKRGSHVGLIMSFAIFITFVAFIYSIMEPSLKVEKNKEALLESLERNLMERVSESVTTIVVVNNSSVSYDCLNVNSDELNITGTNSVVKDKDNNILGHNYSGGNLKIAVDGKNFFRVFSGESLSTEIWPLSCATESEYYNLGLVRTENYVSEKRIVNTIERTNNDYLTLKNELNVPTLNEFGIEFTSSNGTITKTNPENISTSVYSDEVQINYMDEKANIVPGTIIIKIW